MDTIDLRHFINPNQLRMIRFLEHGEEGALFRDKMRELEHTIATMPQTGESADGDNAVAHLHYFTSRADFYITERDMGSPDDAPEDRGRQFQAFGLADLYHDGGEVGYISVAELLECNVEIDLHWKPRTLASIRAQRTVAA